LIATAGRASARPNRLSLPHSCLDTCDSAQSLNDAHSLPTGSCASEGGSSGTLPMSGSFESMDMEVQSAGRERVNGRVTPPALSSLAGPAAALPHSDLSSPETLAPSAATSPDVRAAQRDPTLADVSKSAASWSSAAFRMGRRRSGEHESSATTVSSSRVDAAASPDRNTAESGLTSLNELAAADAGAPRASMLLCVRRPCCAVRHRRCATPSCPRPDRLIDGQVTRCKSAACRTRPHHRATEGADTSCS
jgi:hypothetical protein